ncbi:Snf7 [Novymonas esmeraldas]|uniref:Snf7 n=1 Tax=Novymonas esmeraldas TaxID=1808958 RepID=A0AAW0EZT7_9TRYP
MGTSSSKSKPTKQSQPAERPQKSEITPSDKARLQLKLQRDNLQAAVRKYERVATLEHEKAREFMRAGNKRKALYCLKREKAQESQITTVTDMLDNVQCLINTVEFAQIQGEVVAAMRDGKSELDNLNKLLNIDDIERLMDETSESIEEANQINAVLSQPLAGVPDDDELLRELERSMGTKKVDQNLPNLPVPTHPVTRRDSSQKSKEDAGEENETSEPAREYA